MSKRPPTHAFPQVSNLTPSPDTQRRILFFSGGENEGEIQLQQEEERFLNRFDYLQWNKKEVRLHHNVTTARDIIIDGYEDTKRRTGEHTFIHPLRVFLRGLSESYIIEPDESSIHHASLLARIFHDAKEDFTDFRIDKTGAVSFKDQSRDYILHLEPSEKELLELQIEALSIPPQIDCILDSNTRSEMQISHLLKTTQIIHEKYGSLAAYQTLRIKLDDRTDNLHTYYAIGNENSVDKLVQKLQETILFFDEVEKQADTYFTEYKQRIFNNSGKDIHYPDTDKRGSAVRFCLYILAGGGYDELDPANPPEIYYST